MAMNGSDLLLLVNTGTPETPVYEAVGSQRDATIDEGNATIDVSSKDSRAQQVLAGRYSSSVSLDALYVPNDAAFAALQAAMRAGELILIAREEDGTVVEVALANIDSMSQSFPDQGEATISISLTVSGEWEAEGS
jgi:TP901-1 family phage major tail protein